MYNKVSCPVLVLQIIIKLCKFISCVYSKVHSKLQDFVQIKRTIGTGKLNVIAIMHWWTFPLVENLVIYLNSDIWCILLNIRQNHMHWFCMICIFSLVFFGKIWVPSCTCMFKIWLKKCKTKHPTKLWCWKYAFAIEELIFFHLLFYLLFGCSMAKFGPLLRGQPH